MQLRQLDDFMPKYEAALAWLKSMNVSIDGRFAASKEALTLLRDVGRMSEEECRAHGEALGAALVARNEATDFVRVWLAYSGRETPALVQRLRESRAGPDAGVPETGDRAFGRNRFAELAWGSMLEHCGLSTTLDGTTDVLQIERVPASICFAWEVKRPSSYKQLQKRLSEGRDQVEDACAGRINRGFPKADAGCVVLSLDLLFPYSPLLVVPHSQEEILAILKEQLNSWVLKHDNDIRRATSRNCLAVVVWWRTLAVLRKPDGKNIVSDCNQLHFRGFQASLSDDWRYQFLHGWTSRLQAIFP